MSGLSDGLKQISQFVQPRNLQRLKEANALGPKNLLGLGYALPWLLMRGPSLGITSQMHSLSLGDKPALYDRDGMLTWRELDRRSNQAAHLLEARGIGPADRVAVLLRNGREMVELAIATQKLGIVACPLNTWAKPKELKATLKNADPSILVYDTAHAEQVEECAPPGLRLMYVGNAGDALEGSDPYHQELGRQPASPPAPFTRDRGTPKVIIHTSGTTGTPKGAARNASAAGISALANLLAVVPYSRDDVIYCPAPLFHSFGLATFTFATVLGATLILPEKFDPEESLRLIDEHRATAASFVPVMMRRIVSLDDDVKERYDMSSLRIVMASGSVLSEDLRKASIELFGDVLYDLYGSTEIGWVAIATPEDMRARPKTVGKPVEGIDVAIISPDGEKLPPGETGELYVKSDILFEGYTSGEAKAEREGYMSIGDLGRLDEEGYLYVESRSDDMVVVGGENVYPIEVEQVIEDVPGVNEVTVFGLEDEEYGHVLVAFVVGNVSEEDVSVACKKELASYKVPRRIEVVDDLPRTSTGKVLKRELVEQLRNVQD
ncbi:MAG: AMP-binding protein [Actinomycetota bacterium]|nr:AMP-binding protein [Actinomycetota bacterium]